jgi:dihydroceramide fatty acyl 2-hydroxylase
MHHVFPDMKNKLALSVPKICIYMVGFCLLYSLFLKKTAVIAIFLGTLIGLTLYDIAHYYFHFGPEINIPVLMSLRRNHLKHHFRDSNKGFGVSTTIWDKLFGT